MLKNMELIKQPEYSIPIRQYFEIVTKKLDVESGTRSRVQSIWMTPKELEEHIEAKSEYILEAFECGIILFDPEEYLAQKKSDLFMEWTTKGVSRLKWGWSWNIKA